MSITFDRRTDRGFLSSEHPQDVWTDWKDDRECWLFVAAHDDDIVCGAGLTLLGATRNRIKTYAAITSNGCMGYCSSEQRHDIVRIRRDEARKSFEILGVPQDCLYQFDYSDGNLHRESGRRFLTKGSSDRTAIAGGDGLQNTFTWLLRKVRPTRVFMPVHTDLHPDHRAVNSELLISVFHAQGEIWPELGLPITEIPLLYEYATYSAYASPPNYRTRASLEESERRISAIASYESQAQIAMIIDTLRRTGGREYILEMRFELLQPELYDKLFT